MKHYRVALRAWANRNWWWLACGYGVSIVLSFWYLLASSPKPIPDRDAMMFTVAMSATALTGVVLKCKPGYAKLMTRRQARFNPGNDR